MFGPATDAAEFVELLGATVVPDAVAGTPAGSGEVVEVSLELLPASLADAESVLALRYGGSARTARRRTTPGFAERIADPVWGVVPAVAAGRVAYLDIRRAGGNTGVAGVRLALDDLAAQRAAGAS